MGLNSISELELIEERFQFDAFDFRVHKFRIIANYTSGIIFTVRYLSR